MDSWCTMGIESCTSGAPIVHHLLFPRNAFHLPKNALLFPKNARLLKKYERLFGKRRHLSIKLSRELNTKQWLVHLVHYWCTILQALCTSHLLAFQLFTPQRCTWCTIFGYHYFTTILIFLPSFITTMFSPFCSLSSFLPLGV